MENRKNNNGRKVPKKIPKERVLGANAVHLSDELSSKLIGGIVEKGVSSSESFTTPSSSSSFPLPSPLPFPVARHRSHGPHWTPARQFMAEESGVDDEGNEDNDSTNYEPLSDFANPIKKKKKKGLDFSKWREVLRGDIVSNAQEEDKDKSTREDLKQQKMHEECDMRNTDNNSLGDGLLMDIDNGNKSPSDILEPQLKKLPYNDVDMGCEVISSEDLVSIEEKNPSPAFGSSSAGYEQGHMGLEGQIDAENRALLGRMSTEEIAEAQVEIRSRFNPELLNLLKKRGINKLEKKARSGLSSEGVNALDDKQTDRIEGEDKSSVRGSASLPATQTTQKLLTKPDEGFVRNSQSKGSTAWSSWSKRVEAVRNLRFSLDGNVIKGNALGSTYTADNVSERDFLRTEGDPGAAGYTVKELLALARSVIPGQRGLALHLLASILNKALHNICRRQPDYMTRFSNDMNFVDWEAIWAYALGPEPELALSLRLAIDDNHNSVTLAAAKVIQSILACDLNEAFFNSTMKLARMDLYTAPVFRSRPDINHGFFGGGFWKYSTKPSKIIMPDEDVMSDKKEGERTIGDDNVVAGQDVAAGLVRMELLPRLRYLLEAKPTAALEECILSILIAVARHSPIGANAIWNCDRLVQTIVDRFNMEDTLELQGAKIKSVTLLRVLAQSSKTICTEIINKGFFQVVTWQLYCVTPSIEEWINSGCDKCKLASELMVEQLRFWKVCIMYGLCISCFTAFFPALCLWLNPPTFDMLTKTNVFSEFASITTEIYLVLETLADSLPDPYPSNVRNQQILGSGGGVETWCWSDVFPMVDSALQWLELRADTTLLKFFDQVIRVDSKFLGSDTNASSLLWILSAAMHFLHTVLVRATPKDVLELESSITNEKMMPKFVSKLALQIIKNGIFNFADRNEDSCLADLSVLCSLVDKLCYLRHKSDHEASLASVSCLNGLVRVVVSTDRLIHQTQEYIGHKLVEECELSRGRKILCDGILKSSPQWGKVVTEFMNIVASEWSDVRQIEVFGRGGPAPGVGVGWGAFGGGFWSSTVVAIQADARFYIELLGPWLSSCSMDLPDEKEKLMVQIINSVLASSLIMGPADTMILQKILDILLAVPVLKYLDQCILCYLRRYNGQKQLHWGDRKDELMQFCKLLASHFKSRWLDVKKKKRADMKDGNQTLVGSNSLATIPEDAETSDAGTREVSNSLMVEWARQQMPLPSYWLLSPIATISNISSRDAPSSSTTEPDVQAPEEYLEVAKAGLFLLLGIEAMSSSLSDEDKCPVRSIPLIWRLHSLSVPLLVGMGVLEEEKSRDVYEALQSLYGQCLDELQFSITKADGCETLVEADMSGANCLRFQTEIHENYSTFVETLVEQFAAVSYGDEIFGRQICIYLHRQVESSVRLATWNALSNARVLELLPALDKCISRAEGYLEPAEDNDAILEAYVKSWVSGALDRSATRGSASYMIVVHHLSSFIFRGSGGESSSLRNKLVKSLLRDFSRKRQHEAMMLDLIHYNHSNMTLKAEKTLQADCFGPRLEVFKEACEGNSQLLTEVDKLKSLITSKHPALSIPS